MSGGGYTFYDYFDPDAEVNVISVWLNGEGKHAKSFFTNMICVRSAKWDTFEG